MGKCFSNICWQYFLPYSSFYFVCSRQGQMCWGVYPQIPSCASSQDLKKFRSVLLGRALSTHTQHKLVDFKAGLNCSWPGFQSTVCLLQCIGAAAARSETHLTQDWRCRRSPAARSPPPPPPPPPARSPAAPRGHLHLQLTQTQTFWRPSFQIHFEMLIHKYLVAYIDIALWYLGSKICILLVNFFIILGNNMWAGIFTIRFMALCMELLRMCTGW